MSIDAGSGRYHRQMFGRGGLHFGVGQPGLHHRGAGFRRRSDVAHPFGRSTTAPSIASAPRKVRIPRRDNHRDPVCAGQRSTCWTSANWWRAPPPAATRRPDAPRHRADMPRPRRESVITAPADESLRDQRFQASRIGTVNPSARVSTCPSRGCESACPKQRFYAVAQGRGGQRGGRMHDAGNADDVLDRVVCSPACDSVATRARDPRGRVVTWISRISGMAVSSSAIFGRAPCSTSSAMNACTATPAASGRCRDGSRAASPVHSSRRNRD